MLCIYCTFSAWHYCYNCNKSSKFYCLGCPNAVCKKCFAASEFTIVRGDKGLCCDCMELVVIIEQNLEHDSEGVGVITWTVEFLPIYFR